MQKIITLNPDESQQVIFHFIPQIAGTYHVAVDGLSGTFEVVGIQHVNFSGQVTNAETGQALSGAAVELRVNGSLFGSVQTNSTGVYLFNNIPVPCMIVLKFSKSGYQGLTTESLELSWTGGGLSIGMIPIVVSTYVFRYTNPNKTTTTHWTVAELMASGYPQFLSQAIVLQPSSSQVLLQFQETHNVFDDAMRYGPFIVNLGGPGEYVWDAKAKKLNGVSCIDMPNVANSCLIGGTLISLGYDSTRRSGVLSVAVDESLDISGSQNWGSFFIGKTIEILSNYPFHFEAAGQGLFIPYPLIRTGQRIQALAKMAIQIWMTAYEWQGTTVKYYPTYPPAAYKFGLTKGTVGGQSVWSVTGSVPLFSVVAAVWEQLSDGEYHHTSLDKKVLGPITNWPVFNGYPYLRTECWCHPNPNASYACTYYREAVINGWVYVGYT